MLEQPLYERTDVRDIVDSNPWVRLITATPEVGLVVSHLPVIVDQGSTEFSILGHLAREDAALHQLGDHDTVVIAEGPHGYVSPVWYEEGPYVPTWNFVVAHLHGRPIVLNDHDTFEVLDRTVERFERDRTDPWTLASVDGYARRIAPGVTGFRLTPTRCVGKGKLGQDKSATVVGRVIDALENLDDPHHNAALAAAMRAALVRDV